MAKNKKVSISTLKVLRGLDFFKELERLLGRNNIEMVSERKVVGSTMIRGASLQEFEVYLDDSQVISLFVDRANGDLEHIEVDGKAVQDFDDKTPKDIAKKLSTYIIKRTQIKHKQSLRKKIDISKSGLDLKHDSKGSISSLKKAIKAKKKIVKQLQAKLKGLQDA